MLHQALSVPLLLIVVILYPVQNDHIQAPEGKIDIYYFNKHLYLIISLLMVIVNHLLDFSAVFIRIHNTAKKFDPTCHHS